MAYSFFSPATLASCFSSAGLASLFSGAALRLPKKLWPFLTTTSFSSALIEEATAFRTSALDGVVDSKASSPHTLILERRGSLSFCEMLSSMLAHLDGVFSRVGEADLLRNL